MDFKYEERLNVNLRFLNNHTPAFTHFAKSILQSWGGREEELFYTEPYRP